MFGFGSCRLVDMDVLSFPIEHRGAERRREEEECVVCLEISLRFDEWVA